MSQKIGVGVIGLGWMGCLHTHGYKALAEHFPELPVDIELVMAADAAAENRKRATENLGFSKATSDYSEVILNPEVDVVSICTPNFMHHEIALAAAAADKPFWIEKPMGISAKQSREISEAATAAKLVTAVGFNYRHTPAIQYARQLIRSGELGRITNVRAWLIADYASRPEGPLTWRYDRNLAGAGVFGDLMSHGFDLVQYLVGRIEAITAHSDTFIKERPIPTKVGFGHGGYEVGTEKGVVENEDYGAALFRCETGVVGTIESSRVSVGPRAEYVIEIYGTEGSVRWNFEHLNDLEICLLTASGERQGYTRVMAGPKFGNFSNFQPGPGNSMGFDDLKTIEAKLFLESVLIDQQLAPSAADGWAAAEIDEAAVLSAADQQWHNVIAVAGATTFDK